MTMTGGDIQLNADLIDPDRCLATERPGTFTRDKGGVVPEASA